MKSQVKGIRSPLQLLGLYIGWIETALAAGLWATSGITHWARILLMISAALGLLCYVGTACFIIIYLTMKKPHLLFNPSDYDKDVQKYLFAGEIEMADPHVLDQYVSVQSGLTTNPES